MFTYDQTTGWFVFRRGPRAGIKLVGYAGAPGHVNDPASQHLRSKGPLPVGRYDVIQVKHPRFASPAFRLDPHPETETFGRSGFYIHGDNRAGNRSASSGCIVIGPTGRGFIADNLQGVGNGLRPVLTVVAGGEDGQLHMALALSQYVRRRGVVYTPAFPPGRALVASA